MSRTSPSCLSAGGPSDRGHLGAEQFPPAEPQQVDLLQDRLWRRARLQQPPPRDQDRGTPPPGPRTWVSPLLLVAAAARRPRTPRVTWAGARALGPLPRWLVQRLTLVLPLSLSPRWLRGLGGCSEGRSRLLAVLVHPLDSLTSSGGALSPRVRFCGGRGSGLLCTQPPGLAFQAAVPSSP